MNKGGSIGRILSAALVVQAVLGGLALLSTLVTEWKLGFSVAGGLGLALAETFLLRVTFGSFPGSGGLRLRTVHLSLARFLVLLLVVWVLLGVLKADPIPVAIGFSLGMGALLLAAIRAMSRSEETR